MASKKEKNTAEQQVEKVVKKKKSFGSKVRRFILYILLLAVIALIGLYTWSKLKNEYTTTYQPYSASIGTISNSLSFSGTVQARYQQTATANSAATVKTVYVKVGDKVKEGDKLIRLSNGQIVEANADGTVDYLPYNAGDKVSSGETVCQVVDLSDMIASFRIDEYDINSVSIGDACRITVTATEEKSESTIRSINHVSSSGGNVAYYSATASIKTDSTVYPGMQVTVTIPQEEAADVVILKADAISFDEKNNAFVYIQKEDGTMEKQSITTGVSNGNYVEIKEGLNSGDQVYVEVKVQDTASGGLLSSMFGSTNVMGGGNDFPGGGNMPSFSGGGSGSGDRPSFGGGAGGSR